MTLYHRFHNGNLDCHPRAVLSDNGLKQYGVPMEVQEPFLTAREPSHVNNLLGVDTHSEKR